MEVVARDPAGHGLLCQSQGKRLLLRRGQSRRNGDGPGAASSRTDCPAHGAGRLWRWRGRQHAIGNMVVRSHRGDRAPRGSAPAGKICRRMRCHGPDRRHLGPRRPGGQSLCGEVPLQRRGAARQGHVRRARPARPGARLHARHRAAGLCLRHGFHAGEEERLDQRRDMPASWAR